jgi:hypothetical protein
MRRFGPTRKRNGRLWHFSVMPKHHRNVCYLEMSGPNGSAA